MKTTLVWFSRDLRLADHPALTDAVREGLVVPVFIWSPQEEQAWRAGAASRWWLHQSLKSLDADLKKRGSRLILRAGDSLKALKALARETGASGIYWTRRYEPALVERDANIKKALTDEGIEVRSFKGSLLFEPWEIKTKSGGPFQVFTPFWKACLEKGVAEKPLPPPKTIPGPSSWPASDSLESFSLEPKTDWAAGFRDAWQPGEKGALKALETFAGESLREYKTARDIPSLTGTSRLSPHLHFGEISPLRIHHALEGRPGSEAYLREVIWREFAHHLLFHFPKTPDSPLRGDFEKFSWRKDAAALKAWKKGRTGYPIVDAGLRELWATGWMHNRVRMIAASFLVKDLLISWNEGARWFWETLVDADLANNTLGWQWTAGCGADAAPFFRIFNPVLQGEKFDAAGGYVRRWVPELAELPDAWIHKPWEAPKDVLKKSGISLGEDYPLPIVDHAAARKRALAALQKISKRSA